MHFNRSTFHLLKAFNRIFLYSFPFKLASSKRELRFGQKHHSIPNNFLERRRHETQSHRLRENKLILFFNQDRKIRDQLQIPSSLKNSQTFKRLKISLHTFKNSPERNRQKRKMFKIISNLLPNSYPPFV